MIWEGGNNDATFPDSCCIQFGLNKPADPAVLEGMNWDDGQYDVAPKENLIRQLVEQFGWDSMRGVFASYYDPDYPKETYGDNADGFAHRLSAIAKADLSDFFLNWGYPVSEETIGKIREMGHTSWLPEGKSFFEQLSSKYANHGEHMYLLMRLKFTTTKQVGSQKMGVQQRTAQDPSDPCLKMPVQLRTICWFEIVCDCIKQVHKVHPLLQICA